MHEEKIEKLKDERGDLHLRIREIDMEIRALEVESHEQNTGVVLGRTVIEAEGKQYLATAYGHSGGVREGRLFKKDGTPGAATRYIYHHYGDAPKIVGEWDGETFTPTE